MLATILKSKTASQTTVLIIKTFASMRKFLLSNASIFQRLENVEKRQIGFEIKSDEKFNKIFDAIEEKDIPQKQHIFYDGQIFDAYLFVSDLIKTAKSSIILFVTQVLFISLINIKEYCSYTVANTPFPPLNNVPKRGSSF